MKLVIYKDNEIIQTFEGLEGVEVDGNNITWSTGSAKEVNVDFIVLDNEVEIPDELTSTIISLDKKDTIKKIDLYEENRKLKEENQLNALAIMELAEIISGGM